MTDILVTKWSVDHVCAWVGTQNFRAYKHVFREGLISGRTLLALDHAILEVRQVHLRAAISSPASDPWQNSNSLSKICKFVPRHARLILPFQKLRITEHTHSSYHLTTSGPTPSAHFGSHYSRRNGNSVRY
jgi:hypothetical protein